MIPNLAAFFTASLPQAGFLLVAFSAEKVAKYISIGLVSSIKFMIAVILAIGTPNFTFWDILISAGGGAILGAVVFTFFGAQIRAFVRKRFNIGRPMSFARRRQIYRVWKRFGLPGVAFLAPILSPMVSIGIALSFQERPQRILLFITASILGWTILLATFKTVVIQLFLT